MVSTCIVIREKLSYPQAKQEKPSCSFYPQTALYWCICALLWCIVALCWCNTVFWYSIVWSGFAVYGVYFSIGSMFVFHHWQYPDVLKKQALICPQLNLITVFESVTNDQLSLWFYWRFSLSGDSQSLRFSTIVANVSLLFSSREAIHVRGRRGPPGGVALYVYSQAHGRVFFNLLTSSV